MDKCKDCDNIVLCDRCGKQLCYLEFGNENIKGKVRCVNQGFFNLAEEIICVECYASQIQSPVSSAFLH